MTKWWSGAGPRSKVSAVIAGVLVLIGISPVRAGGGAGLRPDGWAGWFGEPGSWPTALIVVALAGLAVWLRLSESGRRTAGSAVTLVAATGGVSLVLGLASFWRCPTDQVPGVGSLASTLALFVAGGRAPPTAPRPACNPRSPTTSPAPAASRRPDTAGGRGVYSVQTAVRPRRDPVRQVAHGGRRHR